MKRIGLVLCFVGFLCSSLHAQKYDKLWAQVDKSIQKDLPQTALPYIKQIYANALKSKDDGQLLKSLLVWQQLRADIAPDSMTVGLQQIESLLQREPRPVMQALYHTVLGHLYQNQINYRDKELSHKAYLHYQSALSDLIPLSQTRALDYVPVVVKGKDSHYYGDDLLSLIARQAQDGIRNLPGVTKKDSCLRALSHAIIQTYRQRDNREAVLLTTLDSIQREGIPYYFPTEKHPAYQQLIRLAESYNDLPVNVETYILLAQLGNDKASEKQRIHWVEEGIRKYSSSPRVNILRNQRARMMQPFFVVEMSTKKAIFPKDTIQAKIKIRNARKGTLNIYRLNMDGDVAGLKEWTSKDYEKCPKRLLETLNFDFVPEDAYTWKERDIVFTNPGAGVYLLRTSIGKNNSEWQLYYVSNLNILQLDLPQNKVRITVTNVQSGRPVAGAFVKIYDCNRNNSLIKTVQVDNQGNVVIDKPLDGRFVLYAYNSDDHFMSLQQVYPYSYAYGKSNFKRSLNVYTDRGIYRPGQKIEVGGIFYEQRGDGTHVLPKQSVIVTLVDTNCREIGRDTVKTDEFGTLSSSFNLPETCLPGIFSVRVEMDRQTTQTSIRVEEYKRPTFDVQFNPVSIGYQIGDTVKLTGFANSYTGIPLRHSAVSYKIRRTAIPYPASLYDSDMEDISGTIETDSLGHFFINVPLAYPQNNPLIRKEHTMLCRYVVEADVTNSNGETGTAGYSINLTNTPYQINYEWPDKVRTDRMPFVTVYQKNGNGEMVEGTGTLRLFKDNIEVYSSTYEANKPFCPDMLKQMAPGSYRIEACPQGVSDTLQIKKHTFVLFDPSAVRPVKDAVEWIYQDNPEFDVKHPARIQVGTTLKDVVLFYDLFSGDRLLESKQLTVSDTILNFDYLYESTYGDGINAVFAFQKDGIFHRMSAIINKSQPEKKLSVRWITFRDRLRPGQKEEWRLQLLNPDGSPAKASVLASLYDATLDKLYRPDWNFRLSFDRVVTPFQWYWTLYNYGRINLTVEAPLKALKEPTMVYTAIDPELLQPLFRQNKNFTRMALQETLSYKEVKVSAAKSMNREDVVVMDAMGAETAEEKADTGLSELSIASIRSDFKETAFFCPQLRSNENGEVTMVFTLPESTTTWQFRAIAHTGQMNYCSIDTIAIARKSFMLQPGLPRFLRSGDYTELSATLLNLNRAAVKGKVRMTLSDPETGKVIASENISFNVKGDDEQTLRFRVNVSDKYPLLVCRMVADAGTFSDGEQHYLAVLSDKEEIVETIPFTVDGEKLYTVSLSRLFNKNTSSTNRRLTVEYANNPAWYAVQALPSMAFLRNEDALSLASAYYAVKVGASIAHSYPRVREAAEQWRQKGGTADNFMNILQRNEDLKVVLLKETPWIADAENEEVRRKELATLFDLNAMQVKEATFFDKLRSLQNSDGSWSWYKGMNSSVSVTMQVTDMLVRQAELTGTAVVSAPVNRAMRYLRDWAVDRVEKMRINEQKGKSTELLDESLIGYLSLQKRIGGTYETGVQKADRYLIDKLAKNTAGYSMYAKGLIAGILQKGGYVKEAQLIVRSLLEHTVYTPEMGRYFDSDRAVWSWNSYKIPTQTAVLEALCYVQPENQKTIDEMKLWLLQAKRTQAWGNPRSSVDAIYTLLSKQGTKEKSIVSLDNQTMPKLEIVYSNREKKLISEGDEKTFGVDFLGYVRETITCDETKKQPKELVIKEISSQPAFGSIYFSSLIPVGETVSSGSGFTLKRTYEVMRNGKWEAMEVGQELRVGEKIRACYQVESSRDYDFVCLKESRPANVSPANALSGYCWSGSAGYYCAVGDASTEMFFDRLRKGKYTFYTEAYVERAGTYQSGVATIQCLYAPEFRAHTNSLVLYSK